MTAPRVPLRVFRVRWAWRLGNRTYRATAYWKGANARAALDDFMRRNPRAISAHVNSEVKVTR